MPDPSLEPQGDGFNLADWSGSAGLDDDAFEAIGQTVQHAAGAIDGLKDILERLQSSVAEATEQRRNDIEIGQLFMRSTRLRRRSSHRGTCACAAHCRGCRVRGCSDHPRRKGRSAPAGG